MSCTMPSLSAASTWASSISIPSRKRDNGVRKSCDTPASNSARSASIRCRSRIIWLKARDSVRISEGPDSVTGGGVRPCPISVALRVSSRKGRLMRDTMRIAPITDSRSTSAPQPIQRNCPSPSSLSLGRFTQYCSSSILKLIHTFGVPSRAICSSVSAPRRCLRFSVISCANGLSGKDMTASLGSPA